MAQTPRVPIPQPTVPGITAGSPPTEEFRKCVENYAGDLLSEVERLEAGQRTAGTNAPEFTSSMVSDADRLLRRAYRRPKSMSTGQKVWRIVVSASLIAVGVATNNLDEDWGIVLFVVSVTVALGGTIYDLVGDRE